MKIEDAKELINDDEIQCAVANVADGWSCAESCETVADFAANVEDIADAAEILARKMRDVLARVRKKVK